MPRFLARLAASMTNRSGRLEIALAIQEIGVTALPVIALVSVFVGTNVALVGGATFAQFGRQTDVGIFVALAGVREMVPVACAFMLAAKSGTAVAALIASMRLGGQLAAIEGMGIPSVRILALPRLAATIIAAPLLIIFGNAICLGAAALVAIYQLGVDAGTFFDTAASHIGVYDLEVSLVKGLVFGGIIGTFSLFHGFRAERSAVGVGKAANRAVVANAVSCIVINYLLSDLFY